MTQVCGPFKSCLTHSDVLLGSAYAAVYAFSNNLYDSGSTTLIIISWGLGCALNVSITVAIVARLWWTSRTIASLTATPTRNRFASTTYAIIESSAIATVGGVLVLAFFASRSPFALTAFDVLAQVVVSVFLSHLLLHALSRSALAGITSTLNRRTSCDNWSIWLLEYWFLEDDTRSEGRDKIPGGCFYRTGLAGARFRRYNTLSLANAVCACC